MASETAVSGGGEAVSAPSEAQTLLRLVEDSGYGYAVIEEAIAVLKRRMAHIDMSDPAVAELLKAHLRAVGSPTAVGKFFSFELLCRMDEGAAEEVSLEVCRMLAGLELRPDRAYTMERELLSHLGQRRVQAALPPLAVIASRQAGEISKAAAKAAVVIVGSRRKEDVVEALEALRSPEAEPAGELAKAILGALRRSRRRREDEPPLMLTGAAAAAADVPGETSTRVMLRPERRREKDNRLRAILRDADRNPEGCGNCGLVGQTRVAHIIPEARGGTDRPGNLVALCGQCYRRFAANRRNSSSVHRRLEESSSQQLDMFRAKRREA